MISYKIFNLLMPLSVLYSLILNTLFTLNIFRPPLPLPTSTTCDAASSSDVNDMGVAIVTGSNTGIGYQTALSLASSGRTVVIACRSKERGISAVTSINESTGKENAVWVTELDLSSFESVRKFAKEVKGKYGNVGVLVNNAGINSSGNSEDGLDLCFQVRILGREGGGERSPKAGPFAQQNL